MNDPIWLFIAGLGIVVWAVVPAVNMLEKEDTEIKSRLCKLEKRLLSREDVETLIAEAKADEDDDSHPLPYGL